jgi:hypothetical protein
MTVFVRAVGARVVLAAISLSGCLLLAECALRVAGFPTGRSFARHPNEPRTMQPDARLGWKPRAGTWVYPGYAPPSDGSPPPEIRLTFTEALRRSTGPPAGAARDAIVLVGCSFTMGHGISDEETFGWKLQQLLHRPVYNYGVGGYGTYQAFLRLESVLAELEPPPSIVLYGFAGFHATRNAAPDAWLEDLRSATGEPVALPYATLEADGSLARHPPEAFPEALSEHPLHLYRLVGRAARRIAAAPRWWSRVDTSIAIIRAMEALSRAHGARFAVVDLNAPKAKVARRYAEFVAESGIPWVSCEVPEDPEHQVAGDGHPNALANTKYAHCVAAFLDALVGGRVDVSTRAAPDSGGLPAFDGPRS